MVSTPPHQAQVLLQLQAWLQRCMRRHHLGARPGAASVAAAGAAHRVIGMHSPSSRGCPPPGWRLTSPRLQKRARSSATWLEQPQARLSSHSSTLFPGRSTRRCHRCRSGDEQQHPQSRLERQHLSRLLLCHLRLCGMCRRNSMWAEVRLPRHRHGEVGRTITSTLGGHLALKSCPAARRAFRASILAAAATATAAMMRSGTMRRQCPSAWRNKTRRRSLQVAHRQAKQQAAARSGVGLMGADSPKERWQLRFWFTPLHWRLAPLRG